MRSCEYMIIKFDKIFFISIELKNLSFNEKLEKRCID